MNNLKNFGTCFNYTIILVLTLSVSNCKSTDKVPIVNPELKVIYVELRETNPDFPEDTYVFPQVTIPENFEAGEKINADLVREILDADPKTVKKSIFENVWATKEHPMPLLSDISYEYLYEGKNLL